MRILTPTILALLAAAFSGPAVSARLSKARSPAPPSSSSSPPGSRIPATSQSSPQPPAGGSSTPMLPQLGGENGNVLALGDGDPQLETPLTKDGALHAGATKDIGLGGGLTHTSNAFDECVDTSGANSCPRGN